EHRSPSSRARLQQDRQHESGIRHPVRDGERDPQRPIRLRPRRSKKWDVCTMMPPAPRGFNSLSLGKRVQGGSEMPEFMDTHDGFFGATQEQVAEAHYHDLAIEAAEGVHFKHWWADPTTGKVFCLSDGPSKEAVLRVH